MIESSFAKSTGTAAFLVPESSFFADQTNGTTVPPSFFAMHIVEAGMNIFKPSSFAAFALSCGFFVVPAPLLGFTSASTDSFTGMNSNDFPPVNSSTGFSDTTVFCVPELSSTVTCLTEIDPTVTAIDAFSFSLTGILMTADVFLLNSNDLSPVLIATVLSPSPEAIDTDPLIKLSELL